jgi:hypothetical protein
MAVAGDVEIHKAFSDIQTLQNDPVIQGPHAAAFVESLANINYLDRDFYDHSQFDTKVSEKNTLSKYLHKESQCIAKMVEIFY